MISRLRWNAPENACAHHGQDAQKIRLETGNTERFDVELRSIGEHRDALLRQLQHVRGLLAPPETLLAACPCMMAQNISANAAQKLKTYVEETGAHVAIRRHHEPATAKTATAHVEPPAAPPQPKQAIPVAEAVVPASQHASAFAPNVPAKNPAAPSLSIKRPVSELTRALQDKDWTIRDAALMELSMAPSDGAIPFIVKALRDDVWRVRCTALQVLSKSGSGAALKDMARCLTDDVWHVRYCAVDAIGRMESSKAIKPLLIALHDENWQIRQRVAQVLGELRSQRALSGLIASLQDDAWQVRESAARSLGQLRSEKAVKALSRSLLDPNWHVRSMAVSALWQIGSEQAFQPLMHALRDSDWMVHWKAAYALGKIGTPVILPVLARLEQQKNSYLQSVSRELMRALDIVAVPKPKSPIRLEYRSESNVATMSYIPPGEFIMGHDDGSANASPAQRVFLDGYFIDTYEVTNAQYQMFNPAHEFAPGLEDYPVVNVTWDEADAYAKWIGKRLPTEAEWEKAARGADGKIFPWGNEFDPSRCNTQESGEHHLTPVNRYPTGLSSFGVCDMVGNVLEWTADRYKPYAWSSHQSPDYDEEFIVLRGGSWIHPESQSTCFTRLYAPAENRSNFIGFRCVKELE